MSRPPRLHVPGGCYHVTLRGNHREDLFASSSDRATLNEIVADALDRFDARLHAFCWMTNHLHALVQIGESPLGNLVGSVASRYSRYRHKALGTTGHLFERRHGARLVAVDSYFLAVLRYVHLNPVKAGLASDPGEYPWSSHRVYLGAESIGWVTTELGLSLLGGDLRDARSAYSKLVGGSLPDDEIAIEERVHPDDERILGGDEFVARVRATREPARERKTLDELASRVCADHSIEVGLLRSGSRWHDLTPIRLELLERAVTTCVANLTEVARYLGRDPSTLSKQWKNSR